MRIAIVGLGGVGGYIAAHLTKTSHEVVGFARGEHLKSIQKDGITIIEDELTWNVTIDARNLDEADGRFDVVLFCVKSYDLKSSYAQISGHVDSQTILLSLANGVEHGDELRSLSAGRVQDGCVYILSHIEASGVIRKKGKVFALVIGGNESAILKAVFDEASLRTKVEEDIQTAIWKKYIFISSFATLTSYYDNTIGYICEKHLDEAKELLEEIAKVAKSKNINIASEIEKSLEVAKGLPYDASTSMYLDFKNKKRDELETLSGYIVREAKRSGLKVPLMQKMYEELLKRHKD